jgi:hypothetical protein
MIKGILVLGTMVGLAVAASRLFSAWSDLQVDTLDL